MNKVMEKLNKHFGPLEDLYGLFWLYGSQNHLQINNYFVPQPSSNLLNQGFCKMSESFLKLGIFPGLERK